MTILTRRTIVTAASALLGAVVLAGCAPATSTTSTVAPDAPTASSAVSHLHAVDIDEARERVTVATHYGLLSIDVSPSANPSAAARELGDFRGDVMGFVRVGDQFLVSGHPPAGSTQPANIGVLTAGVDARNWQPLALSSEADFHALSHASTQGATLLAGLDSVSGSVMTSGDGGVTWSRGATIAARDIAVDPTASLIVATTESGLQVSDDGGQSWSLVDGAPLLVLVSIGFDDGGNPLMVGVDVEGVLHSSIDGLQWRAGEPLPFFPEALDVGDRGMLAIASTQGVMTSGDAGQTWKSVVDLTLTPLDSTG